MTGVNRLDKTFQDNLLGIDNFELSYHYIKYHIGLKKHFLITSKIVGVCYFQDDVFKKKIFERGTLIFTIYSLGLEYQYRCFSKIKIVKKYCENGDIVDYNRPIFLMEEMND